MGAVNVCGRLDSEWFIESTDETIQLNIKFCFCSASICKLIHPASLQTDTKLAYESHAMHHNPAFQVACRKHVCKLCHLITKYDLQRLRKSPSPPESQPADQPLPTKPDVTIPLPKQGKAKRPRLDDAVKGDTSQAAARRRSSPS